MSAGDLVVAALLLDLEELVDRRERVVPRLAERLQAAAGLGAGGGAGGFSSARRGWVQMPGVRVPSSARPRKESGV
ncbi:hypothetical protein, partial [Actinomyces israelii]